MTGLGIGIIVGAYSVGLWGYFLVRGYNITYKELWTKPPHWPLDKLPDSQTLPGSSSSADITTGQGGTITKTSALQ